jgi:hypothetical protein
LAELIADDVVHLGSLQTSAEIKIFYLCPHMEKLRIFAGDDETPESTKYQKEVLETLELVRVLETQQPRADHKFTSSLD